MAPYSLGFKVYVLDPNLDSEDKWRRHGLEPGLIWNPAVWFRASISIFKAYPRDP